MSLSRTEISYYLALMQLIQDFFYLRASSLESAN